jgi:enoyl-CoA hydratase/carnithine racemase
VSGGDEHVAASQIFFDVAGPVAVLTFNRPEARNALTWEMYDGLLAACERVDGSAEIRVLVIRGAGGKAFAAGTDISQFSSFASREDAIGYERRLDGVIDRLERVRAATIAQVQGAATGGGCAIALACDLRVCTPDARFGVPIARTLGNCLSAANYARMIDLLGPARTKDLLLTGRLMDAAEAAAAGIVARVVDAEAIGSAVHDVASAIAANAPLTIRASKEAIRRIQAGRRPAPEAIDDLIESCYLSADFKEGVAAFLAKRPPRFTGR